MDNLIKSSASEYLTFVSSYLDISEDQARNKIPMTMKDWEERLNGFLKLWDKEVLKDSGKISAIMAKNHAETEFEKYRIIQDRLYQSDLDRYLLKLEDKLRIEDKQENKENKENKD